MHKTEYPGRTRWIPWPLMPWLFTSPEYQHPWYWLFRIYGYVYSMHDDVIKWKHFPRYWPFVRGIHRSPVNSPHKGQWRGALMLTLICVWINGCVNNREAGDLRRYCAHYGVTVMEELLQVSVPWQCCEMRKKYQYILMFLQKYSPHQGF